MKLEAALGHVLRLRRLDAGMTLREVSSKAHLALGYVSEIETARKWPHAQTITMLAKALDTDVQTILSDVAFEMTFDEQFSGIHSTLTELSPA